MGVSRYRRSSWILIGTDITFYSLLGVSVKEVVVEEADGEYFLLPFGSFATNITTTKNIIIAVAAFYSLLGVSSVCIIHIQVG